MHKAYGVRKSKKSELIVLLPETKDKHSNRHGRMGVDPDPRQQVISAAHKITKKKLKTPKKTTTLQLSTRKPTRKDKDGAKMSSKNKPKDDEVKKEVKKEVTEEEEEEERFVNRRLTQAIMEKRFADKKEKQRRKVNNVKLINRDAEKVNKTKNKKTQETGTDSTKSATITTPTTTTRQEKRQKKKEKLEQKRDKDGSEAEAGNGDGDDVTNIPELPTRTHSKQMTIWRSLDEPTLLNHASRLMKDLKTLHHAQLKNSDAFTLEGLVRFDLIMQIINTRSLDPVQTALKQKLQTMFKAKHKGRLFVCSGAYAAEIVRVRLSDDDPTPSPVYGSIFTRLWQMWNFVCKKYVKKKQKRYPLSFFEFVRVNATDHERWLAQLSVLEVHSDDVIEEKFMVRPSVSEPTKLKRVSSGQLLGPGEWLWVVPPRLPLQLMVGRKIRGKQHHTSLAGTSVVFGAGMLYVNGQGEVVHYSLHSGHFIPTHGHILHEVFPAHTSIREYKLPYQQKQQQQKPHPQKQLLQPW